MTDPLRPIGSARPDGRDDERRSGGDRRARTTDADDRRLPVPIDEPRAAEPEPRRGGFAAFAAQMLGGGQKRGLRAGQETIDRARASYLVTEWSGPADRRPRPGRITKTEI